MIISEILTQTTVIYDFTPNRMTIIKKTNKNNKQWKGFGIIEKLVHSWMKFKLMLTL